jgi:hypothetical protein
MGGMVWELMSASNLPSIGFFYPLFTPFLMRSPWPWHLFTLTEPQKRANLTQRASSKVPLCRLFFAVYYTSEPVQNFPKAP